jgi:hypothetical protein
VVNNSRYLVLPERQRYPNLASRVLALCLRRLSADWQQRWKHPVLGVESFVDESKYRGTGYRACGFEAVGPTQGFIRSSRDFYLPHGRPNNFTCGNCAPKPAGFCANRAGQRNWPCMKRKWLGRVRFALRPWRVCGIVLALCPTRGAATVCAIGSAWSWSAPAVSTRMGACGYRAFENACKKLTQR